MTSTTSNSSGGTRRGWRWKARPLSRAGPRRAVLPLALLIGAVGAAPGHAQFGRNKIQYRAFDFEVIETEHFDLHFYPEERDAALDAARMAERSYARLAQVLRHEFRDRKPIIVYASHAHFQQTNALAGFIDEGTGGATEMLKNRVILPFTGSYREFDHVLTHELVHAFQFDVIFRNGLLTEAGPPRLGRIPLWFMEGMAEYLAIGRIDPHTASWVRDATLKGYIRSIEEMNRRDDYLSYRFGQSLWAYIGATWGDEVIGILLQKAPRVGVERAIVSTLGISLDELSADWLTSVRTTHLPELARHGMPDDFAESLTGRRELGDPWYLAPALSPDGERLIFASQRDGFFMDLWLADGRTGEVLDKLVEGSRSPGFESLRYQSSAGAFSPDGSLVAFAAQTGGADALYLYDVDRRAVWRKLTFDLDGLGNPSWSPDGRRLVFTGVDGGVSDLFITDLEGRLTRLTRDPYADLQPAWSPDGRTIAFSSDRGPGSDLASLRYGNVRIALLDLATRNISVLPHQESGKHINPVWSPDGAGLAWIGDRTGVNNLYLFDLERQELRRVTDLLTGIIGTNHLTPVLTWAPGTDRMVFVHFESAGYQLYAVDDPRGLPALDRWGGLDGRVAVPTEPGRQERGGVGPPAVRAGAGMAGGAADAGSRDPGAAGAASRAGAATEADADGPPTPAGVGEPEGPPDADGAAGAVAGESAGEPTGLEAGAPGFTASLYRRGDRFRSSAALPSETTRDAGPLSVMDLLDRDARALPDTSEFRVVDYEVKLTPDLVGRPTLGVQAGGYYGNGVYGGSYVSLSDMLGNHNVVLAANVNGSISDAMFYGGYGLYRYRANLGVALQQLPFYRYRGLQSFTLGQGGEGREVLANVFVRDIIRSASGRIAYPFDAFRRVELGARLAHFQRDNLFRGYYLDNERPLDYHEAVGDLLFVEPSVALVFDNALFGWTGPVDGRRYRLQLSRTEGELAFTQALVDVRNYWSYRQRVVMALRLVALARTGPDSDRFSLFWGGPYFIRGYDGHSFSEGECEAGRAAGGTTRCPVRDQLIGSSGAFANAELRFPVLTELRLGPLGPLPPVDGVVFFDAGLAWDERVCTTRDFDPTRDCAGETREVHVVWERGPEQDPYYWRTPLYSWGLGLRLNVFYAVLRLDYSFPLSRDRNGVFTLAFGPSF